jgi:periplasmic copper chaperone A
MRKRNLTIARLARILACSSVLVAGAAHAGGITVTGGWIRALPGTAPAGGYFLLTNDSGRRIVLTGASSPACGMLMLHKTKSRGGMSSMGDVEAIAIAVGGHLAFAPGGYHLMCTDPTPAIRPGNKVPVTLVFADGSKVTSDFEVRGATGR